MISFEDWAACELIKVDPDFALALMRSHICDLIQERGMQNGVSDNVFYKLRDLVNALCPYPTARVAIMEELEINIHKRKKSGDDAVSFAMRRLQDGLMFGRWIGIR